jgi:hypothetical protein
MREDRGIDATMAPYPGSRAAATTVDDRLLAGVVALEEAALPVGRDLG